MVQEGVNHFIDFLNLYPAVCFVNNTKRATSFQRYHVVPVTRDGTKGTKEVKVLREFLVLTLPQNLYKFVIQYFSLWS